MVVSEESTILYRHMLLQKGEVVTLVKREFLYSLVELSNGRMGYVTNDSLKAAPPAVAIQDEATEAQPVHKKSRPRKSTSRTSSGKQLSEALPKPSFRY